MAVAVTVAVTVVIARPSPRDRYHRSSLVRTRDKVIRIHTINMNWPKHELSEYIHDVRLPGSNAIHALIF